VIRFKEADLLGRGNFADVFKGYYRARADPFKELEVAVKFNTIKAIIDDRNGLVMKADVLKEFSDEYNLVCSVDHPGIFKYVDYYPTDSHAIFVMEFIKGTHLLDMYNGNAEGFSEE